MTSIVLAGGGTAGHTSPLIATAKALQQLEPDVRLVSIGTAKGLETRVIPAAGLELALITPVPLPRRPGMELLKLPWRLTKSVREARAVLRRAGAQALVGFGGYVSIPAYLAARTMRVPVVVHEANKLAGISNRIGARFAAFTAITFRETELPGSTLIGMPMSSTITHPSVDKVEARRRFGLDPQRPTLLVSGGSQGAVRINEAVLGALDEILGAGVQVLHVLGPKNFSEDSAVVEHASGARYLPVAFVEDMAVAYAAADLMVARAGAATVMETAVSGLPVVFVPLPWGNGEQARNAAELVAADAGVMLPESQLSAGTLAASVVPLVTDSARLARMSDDARRQYPADAAENLARAVLEAARTKEAK
ncbi:undecaprenyldiphospho-muramoylpentapeptide beta-N-acetylglucosaminyltransferase [Tessaracoccus rhinocerotis]|uniref:UDP-N-acetylglucosamine--N-acetylmuramyl-(pentapeptide) pyrophosphoryl-undecaprenol N-acetylglucosamine transferase n=1 Tax=Tessaracoccus rhinocerotis TaxID=1689449 RepID=A0A553K2G0_9ACTN|nr:undecaprenyldiphospho-muramoylpentapeptide beta-N-acetylglucosaminyltransferase [Tessaracoccus rhinocerotis]TRY18892.1 undecaprenyldiphospho-muramoylpentapeptide beta-N-acetylglucosaminyltransferase [Tessaracoccus rhinocerotis]